MADHGFVAIGRPNCIFAFSSERSQVCLDRYHAQLRGDCIHICSDALDQEMMVTTLIRCPRARLRLEYDDKPCASSDGPKVVCSKS